MVFAAPTCKAGTRNYIGILTSVNCSASVARFMAEAVTRSGILADYPHVDGVVSFVHGTGCGLAAKGEGYEALERTQWGYAGHANLAAALVVGLGCEVFQISRLKIGSAKRQLPALTIRIPAAPGRRRGRRGGDQGDAADAPRGARRPFASELNLALQCGGWDRKATRGITANTALGAGVTYWCGTRERRLSETRKSTARTPATRRARTGGRQKLVASYAVQEYAPRTTARWKQPSPHKAGGLTTILEKSLGSAAKAHTTHGVYRYAEP